jgi:hypothetical protein
MPPKALAKLFPDLTRAEFAAALQDATAAAEQQGQAVVLKGSACSR